MRFAELVGQEIIKKRFIRSVNENRIPHAQLLRGPEGVGKLLLAIAYAQYICCENRSENDSCGTCPSCLKYSKLIHPDLHFVFPVIKPSGKTSVICDDFLPEFRKIILEKGYFSVQEWYSAISNDAKQGMIYANESDEIMRKLNLKTYESEYKIMIIWLPEKMNITCSNKILKILEEPPAKTIFLLVSNSSDEILTTILSRTQQIIVPRLSSQEIEQSLRKNYDLEESLYAYSAKYANGSYLAALSAVAESDENSQNFEYFVAIMRNAWRVGNQRDYNALKVLRKWSDDMAASAIGREKQRNFLSYSQKMIRENFIRNIQNPELLQMTNYESEFSSKFSPFINERNVEDLMAEFALAERHIEQNVNAKMVFFDLVLKVIMLLKR